MLARDFAAGTPTDIRHYNIDTRSGCAANILKESNMRTNSTVSLSAIGLAALLAAPAMAQSITAIRQNTPASNIVTQDLGHGLQLMTVCHDGGQVKVAFQNIGQDSATLNFLYSDEEGVHASGVVLQPSGPTGGPGPEFDVWFVGGRIEGQFIFANGAGDTTVNLHAFDGNQWCEVQGTAQFAPS
jgi:hypothetical protein